jgi:hypothetical protein
VPLPEQVCTPLPEHWTSPGVHDPEHAPFTQAIPEHGEAVLHVPLAVQVCTPLPEHCVWFGAHWPVHPVPMQVSLTHADGVPHVPAAVHCSTLLPTHWVAPGVQATHALSRHTEFGLVHVVCVTQLPIPSHVWMELPRHRVWLGAQKPLHVPSMQVWPEQGLPAVQVPLALHVCGVLAMQVVWSGAHTPVQTPAMHVVLLHVAGAVH